jgi:hypothetical protein
MGNWLGEVAANGFLDGGHKLARGPCLLRTGLDQRTSATPLDVERVAECPLLGEERKTFARIEPFRV